MQFVFCWHSLYGYWAGVSPDTPELAPLAPRIIMPQPSPGRHGGCPGPTLAVLGRLLCSASARARPSEFCVRQV